MLHQIIEIRKKEWFSQPDCPVKNIINYIRHEKKMLRDAQVEALETYLFLKIAGKNKPLKELFKEGFFGLTTNPDTLAVTQNTRQFLLGHADANALFTLARFKVNGKSLMPELEKHIVTQPESVDYDAIINQIFYGATYPDYLLSLPMGAGKTFLMASIIYLDLYFAETEPNNPLWAHNFILLVPSGLKSSIVPSLKSIERFDPTWVIPNPAAQRHRQKLSFEILDAPKTAKRSNKTRNPNANKIAAHQPFDDCQGLVMVVNAEKVILDRLDLTATGELFERTDDENDRLANELRNLIGKIPNLQIHIDEVHHAATDDIKLRQVVNKWNATGNINGVLGYTGTPYLSSAEKIRVAGDFVLKFSQITNTVFYYPLLRAVKTFLKKPEVKTANNLQPKKIIEEGVNHFRQLLWNHRYSDGSCSKLAIYCGTISRLEEEIFPFLTGDLNIDPQHILKYHKGNKQYKLPKENDMEFATLDHPSSQKRIILLVQIGKEGWDCRSLAGVILSQQGDCPVNMVLQTSCRCLRQADADRHEKAIIWLNAFNTQTLNKQLLEEQNTSIDELNRAGINNQQNLITPHARTEHLKLPTVKFYQLRIQYNTLEVETAPDTRNRIVASAEVDKFRSHAWIDDSTLDIHGARESHVVYNHGTTMARFDQWLFTIARESFGRVQLSDLYPYYELLLNVFNQIVWHQNGQTFYNEVFDQVSIRESVRLAFHRRRTFTTSEEVVESNASLLVASALKPVEFNSKLYPAANEVKMITSADDSGKTVNDLKLELEQINKKVQEMNQAFADMPLFSPQAVITDLPLSVRHKDATFHHIPYNFFKSNFELQFFKTVLELDMFEKLNLEIYYNGEPSLTEFRIKCYARQNQYYRSIGDYTPDFLILQRKDHEIYKMVIVETKGSGWEDQKDFVARRRFMENEFIQKNNALFNYSRFDYLFVAESLPQGELLMLLTSKLIQFFADNTSK